MQTAEENAVTTGWLMNWMRKPRLRIPQRISIIPEKKARVTALEGECE